ncbi:MAG: TetR/AcrR family transcriptional regulator [Roseiflexaceae bacterium]
MPKQTFFNLPSAKRQAIIDLAIAEFAENPYAQASISRIVERAGIAKGSLYQYFEHKQDLFLYLVEYAAAQQLALLQAFSQAEPHGDFFTTLRWQMGVSVRVGVAAPLLVQLMARATSPDLPFRGLAEERLQRVGSDHLAQLVREGIDQGALNPALDPQLIAVMIKSLTNDIGRLIINRLGLSMADLLADPSRLNSPIAEQIFDQIIAILRHGMANPQKE